jgi:hypothetical protein
MAGVHRSEDLPVLVANSSQLSETRDYPFAGDLSLTKRGSIDRWCLRSVEP